MNEQENVDVCKKKSTSLKMFIVTAIALGPNTILTPEVE